MKHIISAILASALLLTCVANADIFGDIGGLLKDASDAVGDAASSAVDAAGNALGDIWESIADSAEEAWNWASDAAQTAGESIGAEAEKMLNDLGGWLSENGASAGAFIQDKFEQALKSLGVSADSAADVWTGIEAYAEKYDIDPVVIGKLALAVIIRTEIFGGNLLIEAIKTGGVAYLEDHLIDILKEMDVTDEKTADQALEVLQETLA